MTPPLKSSHCSHLGCRLRTRQEIQTSGRERERTEGGRTGEAGQRTGGQEDAPHHANHNRQAASALPSSAAQTSTNMHYQVTRTIVKLYIEFNKNISSKQDSKHLTDAPRLLVIIAPQTILFPGCFCLVFVKLLHWKSGFKIPLDAHTHTHKRTNLDDNI